MPAPLRARLAAFPLGQGLFDVVGDRLPAQQELVAQPDDLLTDAALLGIVDEPAGLLAADDLLAPRRSAWPRSDRAPC